MKIKSNNLISKGRKCYKIHKSTIWLFVCILLFPFVMGFLYSLPFLKALSVKIGDALAFYGTALGIFASFYTYRAEKKKEEKKRQNKLKPNLIVKLSKTPNNTRLFELSIEKIGEQPLSYFYLYDKNISEKLNSFQSFIVSFDQTVEEVANINPNYNFVLEDGAVNKDGYPNYIQILCEDVDKNMWNCCFYRIKDGDKIYYYPRDFEIL